ncbi:Uncharacterised protein [Mycobacteroides abscessus subsp. abscessus]|nr:Uncharacterised protein [Mycobacteroides abscessus subsp. abscessus]
MKHRYREFEAWFTNEARFALSTPKLNASMPKTYSKAVGIVSSSPIFVRPNR